MAAGALSGWHYGSIRDMETKEVTEYEAHNLERHSRRYGIAGGRIVFLKLIQGGEVTAYYDRQWAINPKNKSSERTIDILLARFE